MSPQDLEGCWTFYYWLLPQKYTFTLTPKLLSKYFLARLAYFTSASGKFNNSAIFSTLHPSFSLLVDLAIFPPQALADRIAVGCSLVRGEYGRAWNEVKLINESSKGLTGVLLPPQEYIVDLMFSPGTLLKLRSKEADLYRYL